MPTPNPYEPPSSSDSLAQEKRPEQETSPVSWVAILGPLIIQMTMTCSCGHLHLYLLPVTLAILWFAFRAYLNPTSRTLTGMIGLTIAILFVGKHVGDVLWLGHDPIITFH